MKGGEKEKDEIEIENFKVWKRRRYIGICSIAVYFDICIFICAVDWCDRLFKDSCLVCGKYSSGNSGNKIIIGNNFNSIFCSWWIWQ